MRCLTALLLSAAAAAQGAPALLPVMEELSSAVTELQDALPAADRSALAAPLARIEAALPQLRATGLPNAAATAAALTELEAALMGLRAPVDGGRDSDPWDLGRLRRACTHCHLHNRTETADRGLFPNRGGAVAGSLALFERDDSVRDDRGGVVVFLEAPGLTAPPLPRKPSISQQGRQFAPAVLTVTPGTTVRFPNDDVVFHNVFSLSRGNAFDLGIYGQGIAHERVLAHAGLVKVHCNIHPDMTADVLVLATPYTAITGADGTWTIADVAPGDYTLRVWHPLADEQQLDVRVDDARATAVPLTVRETRPRVQHANKHGRRYDAKY